MNAADRTRTTTRRLAHAAAALSGLCAATVQAVAGSWLAAAAALLAAGGWVALRHPGVVRAAGRLARADGHRHGRAVAHADLLVQASFVVLGVTMFAGLAFRLLPLAVTGMWLLVCAADLDRLLTRYPSESPTRVQRATMGRHLRLLGVVGIASLALVGVTVLVAIEVRLPAVILIAAFVVVVLVRIVRSISRGEAQTDDSGGEGAPE